MAALEAVIARLDIRRAQVLVEAIIVEIDVTEGKELGLQWLFANDSGLYGSNISPARQGSNAAIAQAIAEDAASTGNWCSRSRGCCHRFRARPSDGVWSIKTSR